jgi:hypothetical protein
MATVSRLHGLTFVGAPMNITATGSHGRDPQVPCGRYVRRCTNEYMCHMMLNIAWVNSSPAVACDLKERLNLGGAR